MSSGIYKIEDLTNGRCYIGKSVNISQRWRQHRYDLRHNKHHSRHLQRAWNKRGEDGFKFSIIEKCDVSKCVEREQYYLDTENTFYNTCEVSESNLGTFWYGRKGVAIYSKKGRLVKSFDSVAEAVEYVGCRYGSAIRVLRGKEGVQCGGYFWEYHYGEPRTSIEPKKSRWKSPYPKKAVVCLEDGIFYDSTYEAAKAYGLSRQWDVARVCKGERNYVRGKRFQYV